VTLSHLEIVHTPLQGVVNMLGFLLGFLRQFWVLIFKTCKNYWTNKFSFLPKLIISPLFSALIIPVIKAVLERVSAMNGAHPPVFDTKPLQKCHAELNLADNIGCATILFAPDNEMTRGIMREVGEMNQKFGGPKLTVADFTLTWNSPELPEYSDNEIVPVSDVDSLKEYFRRYPKAIAIGVGLNTTDEKSGTWQYDTFCQGDSEFQKMFTHLGFKEPSAVELKLMQLVDSVYYQREGPNRGVPDKYSTRYSTKRIPKDLSPLIHHFLDLIIRIFFPQAITGFLFSIMGGTLARLWQEKRDRMNHYLRSNGLKTFPWLCVHLFLESLQYIIASLVFYGVSVGLKNEIILKMEPSLFFLAILAQGLLLTMFVIWLYTVIPSYQVASQYGLLFSLIMWAIVPSTPSQSRADSGPAENSEELGEMFNNFGSGKALYGVPLPIRILLFPFPITTVSKFWLLILDEARYSDYITWEGMMLRDPAPAENIFDPPEGISSLLWNFALMGLNFLTLLILNWYLKNVLPWSVGKTRPFYFFLTPEYWIGTRPRKPSEILKKTWPKGQGLDLSDPDILEFVEKSNQCLPDNLCLLHVSKTYFKWDLSDSSILSKLYKGHPALRDFTLPLRKSELMALLGHNGAGKSTLMSILTGAITPDRAGGIVFEGNLVFPDYLNRKMGVCAQADLLFDYLTVREHVDLIMGLRNISSSTYWPTVLQRLEAFRMMGALNKKASELSGGMKRRLSLLLSTIGDPLVLLMDEPTAGMDPVNRRFVWKFLHNYRVNRYLFLTTHSMEEAENLAETISIIRKGRLIAVGSSGHLRNRYAQGYRLNLTIKSGKEANIDSFIKVQVPGVILEAKHGGMLRYLVPEESIENMVVFLKDFEAWKKEERPSNDSEPIQPQILPPESPETPPLSPVMPQVDTSHYEYIVDWLFTQMTLEDVFHKLNSNIYQAQKQTDEPAGLSPQPALTTK
jgi:ABC-type multidrug transport system ATPase subunit